MTAANPVPVEVVSPVRHLPRMVFGVSSQSVQRADGELATGFGEGFMESAPDVYQLDQSVPFIVGLMKPGKYYWQVIAGGSATPLQLSPVFWFVVAPGEPQLTLTSAKDAVRASIRDHTGQEPHRMKGWECSYVSTVRAECSATWASTRRLSARTLIYTGSFWVEERAGTDLASFRGTHSRHSCTRRGGRSCTIAVEWS